MTPAPACGSWLREAVPPTSQVPGLPPRGSQSSGREGGAGRWAAACTLPRGGGSKKDEQPPAAARRPGPARTARSAPTRSPRTFHVRGAVPTASLRTPLLPPPPVATQSPPRKASPPSPRTSRSAANPAEVDAGLRVGVSWGVRPRPAPPRPVRGRGQIQVRAGRGGSEPAPLAPRTVRRPPRAGPRNAAPRGPPAPAPRSRCEGGAPGRPRPPGPAPAGPAPGGRSRGRWPFKARGRPGRTWPTRRAAVFVPVPAPGGRQAPRAAARRGGRRGVCDVTRVERTEKPSWEAAGSTRRLPGAPAARQAATPTRSGGRRRAPRAAPAPARRLRPAPRGRSGHGPPAPRPPRARRHRLLAPHR